MTAKSHGLEEFAKTLESSLVEDEQYDHERIFKEAEQYSNENYTVNVKWKKVLNGGWKDYDSCHGTQFILGLSGRGDVFPCGHWFQERRDE